MSLVAEYLSLRRNGAKLVDRVSLALHAGTLTALIGPNGAGKSSLLSLLSGSVSADEGKIFLDAEPLEQLSLLQQARRRSVMTQSATISFDFYVEDILRMAWLDGLDCEAGVFYQALAEIVERCDLQSLLGRVFNTLSGGEQRRVQFARALLQIWRTEVDKASEHHGSRYLLLDEPTANLDLAHEHMLLQLASDQAAEGVAVLAVLHDLNLAARYADQVLLLNQGQLIASGSPAEVLTAERLSEVYQIPVFVEWHEASQRQLILT